MTEEREGRWRAWMAAAQAGDAEAYDRLLRDLLPVVRRFVGRRIHEPDQREDVVQNVFVSIHRARHTWRPERRFGPWLFAIARHGVIDHARARGRRRRREVPLAEAPEREPVAPRSDPGERIDGPLPDDLARALAALPAAQREAVQLVHLEGLSVAEAAVQAGVSPGALKVRAHRGRQALQRRLARRDP